jgi:hypothetical protein
MMDKYEALAAIVCNFFVSRDITVRFWLFSED